LRQMDREISGKNKIRRLKLAYCIAASAAILGGMAIYAFFRNTDNMRLFQYFPKLSFQNSLKISVKPDSIWSNMFIYNLPYGLWCLSGLLFIRAVWLTNTKWRKIYGGIFIAIVMSYVFLKLPGFIPGTFDILDLVFMCLFAFIESIIFIMFIRRTL